MPDLKLTDAERLLLANQYDILGNLHEDDGYRQLAEHLRRGHSWFYNQNLRAALQPEIPYALQQTVVHIIGLYANMQSSAELWTTNPGFDPALLVFPGFDANTEPELRSFAQAVCAELFQSNVATVPDLNAHVPMLDAYRRMLTHRQEHDLGSTLQPSAVAGLLDAKRHPDAKR